MQKPEIDNQTLPRGLSSVGEGDSRMKFNLHVKINKMQETKKEGQQQLMVTNDIDAG